MVANFWFCSLNGRNFRNDKVNLFTGLHQEVFLFSLIVMLNRHPHSQAMLSKIELPPSKNTSRSSCYNGRNVTTSKKKGKFYNYQWMLVGFSPGKFLLWHFPPATNSFNELGICWGHSFEYCDLHQMF